ncbi:MAG: hypothetical protein AB1422_10240 [bacterium]
MKIVSNAGPLIAFGKLGRLDILQKLYGSVFVAEEVYEETVVSGISQGVSDAYLIRDYFSRGIFKMRKVLLDKLQCVTEIEEGEKTTLELALVIKADFVLIDDATAREVAIRYGLKPKGTLSVLLEAVKRNVLIRDEGILLIQQIKRRKDIWIKESLCDLVLERL